MRRPEGTALADRYSRARVPEPPPIFRSGGLVEGLFYRFEMKLSKASLSQSLAVLVEWYSRPSCP